MSASCAARSDGKSKWKNFKSLNEYSIGVEINNSGHDNSYKKFSSKQIISLIKLLNFLKKKYNVKKQNILGHSDIAPDRKKDPGEKFPWKKLASLNLSIWHSLSESKLKKKRNMNIDNFSEKIFFITLFSCAKNLIISLELSVEQSSTIIISFSYKLNSSIFLTIFFIVFSSL